MDLINKLPSLMTLEMQESPWLEDVNFFSARCPIEVFILRDCDSLENLSSMNKLSKLRVLNMTGCDSLESLAVLKTLPSLIELKLNECSKFQSCEGLENLLGLQDLDISRTAVKKFCLRHDNLSSFMATGCNLLKEVDVSGLAAIYEIDLENCKSLETVHGLIGLHSLVLLNVVNCKSLESIGAISDLPELSYVDARTCPKLKKLKIANCATLEAVWKIDGAETFDELWFERCELLSDPMFRFPEEDVTLKKLTIKNCKVSQEDASQFRTMYPEVEFVYEPNQETKTGPP